MEGRLGRAGVIGQSVRSLNICIVILTINSHIRVKVLLVQLSKLAIGLITGFTLVRFPYSCITTDLRHFSYFWLIKIDSKEGQAQDKPE